MIKTIHDHMLQKILQTGIFLFIFFLPWQPIFIVHQEKLGAAQEGTRSVWQYGTLGITFSDCLLVLLIFFSLFLCIHAARTKKEQIFFQALQRHKQFFSAALLFLFIVGISLPFVRYPSIGMVYEIRIIEALILIWCIVASKISLKSCMVALVCAGMIQGILTSEQFFTQHIIPQKWLGIASHSPQELGDSVVAYGDYRWLRAYGSFSHPNAAGFFLAFSLFGVFLLVKKCSKKWEAYIWLIFSLCITTGLFVTFSRSAWFGIFFTFCMWVLAHSIFKIKEKNEIKNTSEILKGVKNSRKTVSFEKMFFVIVIMTTGILGFIFSDLVRTRFGGGGWQRLEQKSLDERKTSLADSFGLIQKHPLGLGIGNYTAALFERDKKNHIIRTIYFYQPVHSLYLLIFTETGIQGLGIFFMCIVFASYRLFLLIHKKTKERDVILSMLCMLFLFLFVGMFDHFFWTTQQGVFLLWFCFALILLTKQEAMIE